MLPQIERGEFLVNDDIERMVREAEQAHRKRVESAERASASDGPDAGRQLVRRQSARIFEGVAVFVIAAQSLYVFGLNYCWILLIPLAFYSVVRVRKAKSRKKDIRYRINPIERFNIGSYVAGFEEITRSMRGMECLVGESDFIFVLRNGEELVRIPRNAVNHISVVDRVDVVDQPALGRKLVRGLCLALAGRRGEERGDVRCLAVDWSTEEGPNRKLFFEFSGPYANEEAYAALNMLYRYLRPRAAKPGDNERTCPHCGEIVRKTALICVHCGKFPGKPVISA